SERPSPRGESSSPSCSRSHDQRRGPPPRARDRDAEPVGLRARAAPDRDRAGRDADAVGERRAVEFPDALQGEISGLSRAVTNLGSSFGAAVAGTVLVAGITVTPERSYGVAMVVLAVAGVGGLVAALRLPKDRVEAS